jgi:enoyl-CoA hydratase
LFLHVWECPKPIVAEVHGFCFAAGVQLAAACDLVIVTDDCRLGWPKLPLGGGFISPMLTWAIGPKRAKEMTFQVGSEFSGREAATWGFANLAVPADLLEDSVQQLLNSMTRIPCSLLGERKALINSELERSGYSATVLWGAEWDALAHEDVSVTDAYRQVRDSGFRNAIESFRRTPSIAPSAG